MSGHIFIKLNKAGTWANRTNPGSKAYSGEIGDILRVEQKTGQYMIEKGHAVLSNPNASHIAPEESAKKEAVATAQLKDLGEKYKDFINKFAERIVLNDPLLSKKEKREVLQGMEKIGHEFEDFKKKFPELFLEKGKIVEENVKSISLDELKTLEMTSSQEEEKQAKSVIKKARK